MFTSADGKKFNKKSLQVQVTSVRLVITGVALHVSKMVQIKFNKTFTRVRLVFYMSPTCKSQVQNTSRMSLVNIKYNL